VLVEGAWTYRLSVRTGEDITRRNEGLPQPIRAAAWKAQLRLCTRYRRLQKAGKPQHVIAVEIAREMAAFVWAISRMAQPAVTVTWNCSGPSQKRQLERMRRSPR
jgi:hypothetical protein